MAIKGLVDTSRYLVNNYAVDLYINTDYYNPSVQQTISSAFSLQARVSEKDQGTATLNSAFTQTTRGNFKVVARNLNYTAFNTQVSIGYRVTFGTVLGEYTWDSFAESSYVDKSWEDWFGDAWDPGGIIYSTTSILQASGGYRCLGFASAFSNFTQIQNYTRVRKPITPSTFTATATQTGNGYFIARGKGNYTSTFTQNNNYIRYRGLINQSKTYDSIFSTFIKANAIFRSLNKIINTSFNTNIKGNAKFGPNKEINAVFSSIINGNSTLGITNKILYAFASELVTGSLISLPDPYNTFKVLQEFKQLIIPAENRTFNVLQETRVNSIQTETRIFQVLEETRDYKIFRPKFSNRSSIPRVRSDY